MGNDCYDLEALSRRLTSCPFGRPLHYFESIDSTNSFLRAVPRGEIRHGTLALADHQRSGRGKYDRRWVDKPGLSLLFSLLLETDRPAAFWPLITLGAAVSVCRSLEKAGIAGARIHWPNDVLIAGKKVCGILTEKGSTASALVVGIGLNVHQSPADFPPELRSSSSSLRMAARRPWKRADLLVAILNDFATVYTQWRKEEEERILAECRRRMTSLGRTVRLRDRERCAQGIVMGLERDGSLVVRESSGILSQWHSANVEEP